MQTPFKQVVLDDPDHQDTEDMMEFRLTYEGKLLGSSRNNPRARHKHEIRRVFHKQLKRLWDVSPFLQGLKDPPVELVEVAYRSTPRRSRIEALAQNFARNGYNYVPLVTFDLGVTFVGIDILFLRPEPPGRLLESGDLDNRLKTIFDALKMPENAEQLSGYDVPGEGETPFYCLLENDKMISKVAVETDLLLQPVGTELHENDARIIVKVSLQPRMPRIDMRYVITNLGGK